jgi:hypothetical protein
MIANITQKYLKKKLKWLLLPLLKPTKEHLQLGVDELASRDWREGEVLFPL